MEVVINRHRESGNYFINIAGVNKGRDRFVAPNSRIMDLEFQIFDDEIEGDLDTFVVDGLISNQQAKRYEWYSRSEREDEKEQTVELFMGMSKRERDEFLERLKKSL